MVLNDTNKGHVGLEHHVGSSLNLLLLDIHVTYTKPVAAFKIGHFVNFLKTGP